MFPRDFTVPLPCENTVPYNPLLLLDDCNAGGRFEEPQASETHEIYVIPRNAGRKFEESPASETHGVGRKVRRKQTRKSRLPVLLGI